MFCTLLFMFAIVSTSSLTSGLYEQPDRLLIKNIIVSTPWEKRVE